MLEFYRVKRLHISSYVGEKMLKMIGGILSLTSLHLLGSNAGKMIRYKIVTLAPNCTSLHCGQIITYSKRIRELFFF